MIVDEVFEEKVLACLFRSRDFCMSAAPHLGATYFEGPVKHNMSKLALDFFKKYEVVMTGDAFLKEAKKLVAKGVIKEDEVSIYTSKYATLMTLDVTDWAYVLENLILFIKNREMRILIEDAVKKHLPKDDFESIEKGWQRIAQITTSKRAEGYDYYSDASLKARALRRGREITDKTKGISTGIREMDNTLYKGGWYRKELYVILAPPKRGKTMSLLWFANAAMWQGFNVGYWTCETSTEILTDRLDAMNADIEMKWSMPEQIIEIYRRMSTKKPTGNLFMFEYPTKSLTVPMAEGDIRHLALTKGHELDMAIFDYGDIMVSARKYQNKLDEQASIFEDLRGLAGRFEIPTLTASQVNRGGSDKPLITGSDVAGTWEKIMVADGIITLSATQKELDENFLRIHFSESRNNPRKTFKIKTSYNFGKFYKEYVGAADES